MGRQGTGNPTGTMPEVGQARRLDVPLTSNHDVVFVFNKKLMI